MDERLRWEKEREKKIKQEVEENDGKNDGGFEKKTISLR